MHHNRNRCGPTNKIEIKEEKKRTELLLKGMDGLCINKNNDLLTEREEA